MGDVEHAHSARIDVDVSDRCGRPGHGVRLDVLGDRAPAASDVRATSQGRWHRIAGRHCLQSTPAQRLMAAATVRHLQFSEKLSVLVDASLDGNLRR